MNDKDLQLEQAPDFGKSKIQPLVVLLSTKYKLYDMVCFFRFCTGDDFYFEFYFQFYFYKTQLSRFVQKIEKKVFEPFLDFDF